MKPPKILDFVNVIEAVRQLIDEGKFVLPDREVLQFIKF